MDSRQEDEGEKIQKGWRDRRQDDIDQFHVLILSHHSFVPLVSEHLVTTLMTINVYLVFFLVNTTLSLI